MLRKEVLILKRKMYLFTKICFLIVVLSVSIYLKVNNFLYIAPLGAFDQTLTINQFNEFSKILLVSSLLLLVIFFLYYKMTTFLSHITLLDILILLYYFSYFMIVLATLFAQAEFDGELAQLTFMISSITFLQSYFLNIVPVGIFLYIPIIYLFFLRKNHVISKNR